MLLSIVPKFKSYLIFFITINLRLSMLNPVLKTNMHLRMKKCETDRTATRIFFALTPFLIGSLKIWLLALLKCLWPSLRKSLRNDVVLITGGSTGIGYQVAQKIAKLKPKKLILWSTNEERLAQVSEELRQKDNVDCTYMVCDVGKKEVYDKARQVLDQFGAVTVLINNAGIVSGKCVLTSDVDEMQRTVEVNTLGQIRVFKAFFPKMIQAKRGHVVFMNSMLGVMGLAGAADYVASKYALTGFTEALRLELVKDYPYIQMSCIHPYLVDTGMFKGCQVRFPWLFPALKSDYVAKKVVDSIQKNIDVLYLPRVMYFMPIMQSILPYEAWKAIRNYFWVDKTMDNFYKRKLQLTLD